MHVWVKSKKTTIQIKKNRACIFCLVFIYPTEQTNIYYTYLIIIVLYIFVQQIYIYIYINTLVSLQETFNMRHYNLIISSVIILIQLLEHKKFLCKTFARNNTRKISTKYKTWHQFNCVILEACN